MSYKSQVDFIRDTITDLEIKSQFLHFRDFDFEQIQQKSTFVSVLMPLVTTILATGANAYVDQTSIRLMFLKLSKADFKENEIIEILDQTKMMADEFVRLMHWNIKNDDRLNTSQGINFVSAVYNEPKINETGEILTGQLLVHDVVFPDEFDYCAEC